jgi:Leu/Phe-tRNA-protein transferase
MSDVVGYYTPDLRVGTAFGEKVGSAFVVLASDYQKLEAAAKAALHEMCHTISPRNSFTDAVDRLDAALNSRTSSPQRGYV